MSGLFLNVGVDKMLQENDFCTAETVIPIIGTYIDSATEFQNDASIIGFYCMHSDIISKPVSQNYDRVWFVIELKSLCKDVCSWKKRSGICFRLYAHLVYFRLKFHLLYNFIENILRFGSLTALDASPCALYSPNFKNAYRYTSKQSSTRLDEMMLGPDQVQSNAF